MFADFWGPSHPGFSKKISHMPSVYQDTKASLILTVYSEIAEFPNGINNFGALCLQSIFEILQFFIEFWMRFVINENSWCLFLFYTGRFFNFFFRFWVILFLTVLVIFWFFLILFFIIAVFELLFFLGSSFYLLFTGLNYQIRFEQFFCGIFWQFFGY